MALVNIPRDRDDPNYRYKMPRLASKIEGRGNGIKTNISNMGDIAKALKRPPMYPTKFFGCELGAMAKFEEAEEKAIINGAHAEKDLIVILDKFIDMYVLCPGCHLPEMDISVKKGSLCYKCNACGHLGGLDMTHKAATYMIRNPPDNSSSTLGKKKKSKEERRAEKAARRPKDMISEDEEEAEKEEKKKEKKKEKKDKGGKRDDKKMKRNSREASDDDSPFGGSDQTPELSSGELTPMNADVTESVSEKKKKGKSATTDKLMLHEVLHYESPEIAEVGRRLCNFLQSGESVGVESFYQEVRMLQVSQDFDAKCRLFVVLDAMFGDNVTPEGLMSKMPFVKKVIDSTTKAFDVLNAVEYYCHEKSPATLSLYPYIIQKFYAAEVLDSDDILKHYKKSSACPIFNKCKKTAEPFLIWLQENDSEDEGGSDEEEQVASKQPGPTLKSLGSILRPATPTGTTKTTNEESWTTASTTPNTTKGGEEEEEEFHDAHEENSEDEDIDIDNI